MVVAAIFALAALLVPAQASAAPAPAWQLTLIPLPTNLEPGTVGFGEGFGAEAPFYRLLATNVGSAATSGSITFTASFPPGIAPLPEPIGDDMDGATPDPQCTAVGQQVTCTTPGPVYPSRTIGAKVPVAVSASANGQLDVQAQISGGGAGPVSTTAPTTIGGSTPFGFLPGAAGLSSVLTDEDGSGSTQAGSHPDQMTVNLAFPTKHPVEGPSLAAGHVHDVITELPQGLIVNPNATSVRCTEVEFIAKDLNDPASGCPDASQIGTVEVMTELTGGNNVISALYSMVPPPGVPAEVAFDALQVGIFVHLDGGLRSEGDYGLTATSSDILARTVNPLLNVKVQLWGDPSSASHDEIRGDCRLQSTSCPVPTLQTPLLTMPSACSGPLVTTARADSWEDPGNFVPRSVQSTDPAGSPTDVTGCSLLDFDPSLTLRPDTQAAESPTGVAVSLHVPQNEDKDELATSNLKDVTATLPEGMAVNPSSANGLDACTPSQVGLTTPVGQGDPIHFTNAPDNCPDAAKIGSVEVTTPLLDHPIPGAVYVATPHQNPFDSLLAIYISIKSPDDGIYAKLAGRVAADPRTGQLTTTFAENPQLPVEDFKLDFFGGPRAALRTPADCGSYATASVLTPWSGRPAVQRSDNFQIDRGPNGGGCTTSEGQRANAPSFEAGTKTPLAAAYSPFVMKLSREDGQQLLTGIDLTLPPGLSGKLAGVATCSDAEIAAAAAKSGKEEQASPSCPANSQVGEVTVGAGAGSTPYYTKGKIYLAGPYQGAPISFAIVTPAVAGPYDLGNVVTRAAAQVNPVTAQISVHSDPLPTILQGIPLQLRDVRVEMGRDQFTLNPSSCERMQLTGTATSAAGQGAGLANPFQVGGCRGLSFKPDLKLTLKGGTKRTKHPALKSVLTVPGGGSTANIARAVVILPASEFIDQAHIGNPCTRPQFNAGTCPKISVLGRAKAWTPLLDHPLEGNVYFRSNGGERTLPDIVVDLRGQIHVELVGAVDSVVTKKEARIRTTFFQVPDAPVSRFQLQLKGGKEGVLVNSANLCRVSQRATVKLTGHNNATYDTQPKIANQCDKHRKG